MFRSVLGVVIGASVITAVIAAPATAAPSDAPSRASTTSAFTYNVLPADHLFDVAGGPSPLVWGTGTPGANVQAVNVTTGAVVAGTEVRDDGTWDAYTADVFPNGSADTSLRFTQTAGADVQTGDARLAYVEGFPYDPAVVTSPTAGGDVAARPTVSGTDSPGETIRVIDHANTVIGAPVMVDADGTWEFTFPSDLAPGSHHYLVQSLPLGGDTFFTTPFDFVVSAGGGVVPPTATPVEILTPADAEVLESGLVAFTGSGEPAATVTLTDRASGADIASTVVRDDGTWAVRTTVPLDDGTYTVDAEQVVGAH